MRTLSLALFAITLSACATSNDHTTASSMRVVAHWPVAGEGRWDLVDVDPGAHRLYLSRSDRVQAVDTLSGALIGEVPGTAGVHGIAIVPSSGRGYATDGKSDAVTEFDLGTLAVTRQIPVSGHSPDAVIFDTHSRRLFVFDAGSNEASVIDVASGKEVSTIAFDGNPELAATDNAGHLYVNLESSSKVVEIDTDAARVLHTWPLAGCEEPTGLALDAKHARLFSACANGIMAVTDARDGRAVAQVPIGDGPDGIAFDAERGWILVPNGRSGTLTVVQQDAPDRYHVRQTLETQVSARTIAFDPATHRAYLPAARFGPKPAGNPEARAPMLANSFDVIVVEPQG